MKKSILAFFLFGGVSLLFGITNVVMVLAGYGLWEDLLMQAIPLCIGVILLWIGFRRVKYNKTVSAQSPLRDPDPAPSQVVQPVSAQVPAPLPACPEQPAFTEADRGVSVSVPVLIGAEVLVYHYEHVRFDPSPDADRLIAASFNRKEYELSCSIDNDTATFRTSGGVVGHLVGGRLVSMLADWAKRGDSYRIYVENVSSDRPDGYLFLAFYRDEQRRLSNRENEVVALTQYKNEDCQIALIGLEPGTKLGFDEDSDDDLVFVEYGASIGALPASVSQRYRSEGAAGVFLESADFDDDKGLTVPTVRIYW